MVWEFLYRNCKKQLLLLLAVGFVLSSYSQNPIVTENKLPGNPASEWDVSGSGSSSLQGFATDISVNKGQRINFKINTSTVFSYTIKIYRLGYYQGNGARLITDLGTYNGTVQPKPITNTQTGLVDCGNWSVSAYWDVPSTAVSGVYIAKLTRTSSSSTSSHIVFIVRDDASTSDLFFQTSDATWQAYNNYGGNSLYVGATSYPQGHAVKVSYNRPFLTRAGGGGGGAMMDWLFNAEYPMIRFLERNGYDMTYTTNVDAARRGNLILNHKVFLSVGHDEYWSAEQRNNVEAARNAGVHLAFFSGNEVYWKTRWENSVDGTNTPYRTLVCYKEGTMGEFVCGNKCDPTTTWTGLWRDGCSYPSGGGCKPENALQGQIGWTESTHGITVSSAYKNLAFWRNTAVASLGNGQSVTLPNGVLGYEWDYEQYTSSYPANRVTLSSTTVNGLTHKLSLYTHSSGAMVFGAGTVQWSWGLDDKHDRGSAAPSIIMQQATVNLLGDMGAMAGTLMSGLVSPAPVLDLTPPVSVITSPAHGTTLPVNAPVTISGTSSDAGGGTVSKIQVSVNGGSTWQDATGTTNWSFSWTPASSGTVNIRVRGTDNSNNVEVPGANGSANNITINVTAVSDNTPPVSIISSPPHNSSVIAGTPVTISGTASDVGGIVSAIEVSVNGGSSWQAATGTTSWTFSWTPASAGSVNIRSRARDNSGNTETPGSVGSSNSITVNVTSAPTTYTIFQANVTPQIPLENDGQAIELGVKFRSTSSGYILGIRYYKGAGTSGTHSGSLWSSSGTRLATANFTNETASGWQQVLFTTPVAINANTTYVASYFSSSGDYCSTNPFFTSATTNGPIKALANGEDGPNGVYRYTNTSAFPNSNYQSSNYFVDVVFATSLNSGTAPSVTTQPGSQTLCAGNSVTFTSAANGSPATTVQWQVSSNGGSTWTNISGATSATYTFTAAAADNNKRYRSVWTNSEGSVNSDPAVLTVNAIPAAPSVTVTDDCGISVLTAGNYTGTLLWNNTATTQSITVSTPGTYTVTQTVNGCTSATGSGTAAPKAVPAAPTVTVTDNCGNSVLTATNYTGTLLWSTGETTASITVTTPGTYTVTQTIGGCTSATGSGTAAPKAVPAAPIVTVTDDCGNSVLTATDYTGTLLWSTGETTASITVTTPGTYTVTQTIGGCTSAAGSGTAAPKAVPAAPIVTVTDDCGNSVLTATDYTGTLLWSTGETTASITVTTPGTYTVTQTIGGCISATGSGTAAPKAIPSAPTVTVVNDCGSSVLTATNYTGELLWSTGETTSSITVTTPGTYTVTQSVNGCVSPIRSRTAAPKAIPQAPTVIVSNNCGNSSLVAGNYTGSLLWNTGATTPSLVVNEPGIYTVIQTVNGCTSAPGSGTAEPVIAPDPAPIVSVINNCTNSILTASGYTGTLLWSTGETTASITVTTPGIYTVTQTTGECPGMPGSGIAEPSGLSIAVPVITVEDNCGSSVLTASGYTGTLLWSTGETTESITVTTPGDYTVTQTVNGCVSDAGSGKATPKVIPQAPAVIVNNNCGESTLVAGNYTGSLLWSTGATTPSISVSTPGDYTVTQTVNGCTSIGGTGTAAPVVSTDPAPTVTVINNCGNSVLTASGYTGTLLWSTGETTASITVTTGGVYTVTQTIGDCPSTAGSGVAAPFVSVDPAPIVTVVDNCGYSVLTASDYTGTLLWSTGETTESITVTAPGIYTVTQSTGECPGTAASVTVSLKAIPSAPVVTVVNNCGNSVLTASGYTGTLLWSTGETTGSITVTTPGAYIVTQTVDGCTSESGSETAAPVIVSDPAPTVTVVDNCGNSVLTASDYTGTLLWSTGETTASITVTVPGEYTVTQTIGACPGIAGIATASPKPLLAAPTVTVVNNCGSSVLTATNYTGTLLWSTGETTESIVVTTSGVYTVTQTSDECISLPGSGIASPVDPITLKPTITASGVTTFCQGGTVTLTSSLLTENVWSTGATTRSITVSASGNYFVTNNNSVGCIISSDTVPVIVNPLPAGSISSSGTVCENGSPTVVFNATSGTGPYKVVINGTTYDNVTNGSAIVTNISTTGTSTSLWANTVVPAIPTENDGQAIEVGMKFRTTANGVIRSLRFYKGNSNDASTYVLKLYLNSNRTLLASVNFSNRTATGWQTVDLPVPVSVAAGVTYLVSYYSPSGNYANNLNYFGSARTVGPLTALANGTDGSNGVYRYGTGGGYPTSTYRSSNYWVDVVFSTAAPSVTLNMTSITDANNCSASGSLSTVTLQVVPCTASRAILPAEQPSSSVNEVPSKLVLEQNYPNPFTETTLIRFGIPSAKRTRLVLYDLNGRVIDVLVNEVKDAGYYTIPARLKGLPAGIYYYKLEAGGQTIVKKMTLL